MLRNKEFKRFLVIYCLIAVVLIGIGFTMNKEAGILAVISSVVFGIVFVAFTKARYNRIAMISDQIDLVLHNKEHLQIDESEEGELSILHSEITKMMLRIREQNDALKKEKEHLADSLADIAHQLRTPLTSVNLILSLLENNPGKQERVSLIREADELLVHMDWLLNSLLKISRLDAGIVVFQNERIEVKSFLNAAIHPFLISMELHNIGLKVEVPNNVYIQGDSGWLTEAVRNILKNCMESAGENGLIEISCRDTVLYSEIVIHDSGAGFEQDELPCLFSRFYRGKSADATGYGIGLALCRNIIVRMGGTVNAKNHPEGGALFSIRFSK